MVHTRGIDIDLRLFDFDFPSQVMMFLLIYLILRTIQFDTNVYHRSRSRKTQKMAGTQRQRTKQIIVIGYQMILHSAALGPVFNLFFDPKPQTNNDTHRGLLDFVRTLKNKQNV